MLKIMYQSHKVTNSSWALMASSRHSRVVDSWCLALCLLLLPLTIAAQEATGPYDQIKGDVHVVRMQLLLGVKYADLATMALQNSADEEQLNRSLELAKRSYVYLRLAMHGVELLIADYGHTRATSTADKTSLKYINAARQNNLRAQTAIQNSIPSPENREHYVQEAIQGLQGIIPRARLAAKLIF